MVRNFNVLSNNISLDEVMYGKSEKSKPKRQPVAQSTKRAVLIEQRGKCAFCKKHLVDSIHYDHIKEVRRGGRSTTDNLRAVCASCHDKRHILDKAKAMDKKRRSRGKKEADPFGLSKFNKNSFKFRI